MRARRNQPEWRRLSFSQPFGRTAASHRMPQIGRAAFFSITASMRKYQPLKAVGAKREMLEVGERGRGQKWPDLGRVCQCSASDESDAHRPQVSNLTYATLPNPSLNRHVPRPLRFAS